MDRIALRYALKMTAWYALLSIGSGLTIWAAILAPTWALMRLADWPFIDAYMTGAPVGIFGLCVVAIGVMSYRHKRRKGWQG